MDWLPDPATLRDILTFTVSLLLAVIVAAFWFTALGRQIEREGAKAERAKLLAEIEAERRALAEERQALADILPSLRHLIGVGEGLMHRAGRV